MKPSVAITLIVVGGLLVVFPAFVGIVQLRELAAVLSKGDYSSLTLEQPMISIYRFGCWLTGTAMIGIAVFGSMRTGKP